MRAPWRLLRSRFSHDLVDLLLQYLRFSATTRSIMQEAIYALFIESPAPTTDRIHARLKAFRYPVIRQALSRQKNNSRPPNLSKRACW